MKNRIILFVVILSASFTTSIYAQPANDNYAVNKKMSDKMVADNDEEITLLTSFKATKAQKKEIKKIKSFVTPKVFTAKVNTATLQGKTVNLQMALDQAGAIKYIVVIDGIQPKIDERVVQLVKDYNNQNAFASSKIEKPSVVQMSIPVVGKAYYGR